MNLVNRGFIQVKPEEKLIEWAAKFNAELMLHKEAEGTLYLIEEDFWDDDVVLKKYSKKIAQQILLAPARRRQLLHRRPRAVLHRQLGQGFV